MRLELYQEIRLFTVHREAVCAVKQFLVVVETLAGAAVPAMAPDTSFQPKSIRKNTMQYDTEVNFTVSLQPSYKFESMGFGYHSKLYTCISLLV